MIRSTLLCYFKIVFLTVTAGALCRVEIVHVPVSVFLKVRV